MTQVKEVKYGTGTADLIVSDNVSPEEARAVEERMRILDKLTAEVSELAKFKLEVFFNDERSSHKPFGGVVTWWENGNKLHGGGDSKMYLCPARHLKLKDCEALIPDSANGTNFIVCPSCGSLWKGEQVFGEVFYRLPMEKWADVLLSWFTRLELKADIRIKYARDDIRTVAMQEQERQMGGELLLKSRSAERRSTSIYPLANIVRDTSAGADLHGRILAFLRA